jgi:hypothetical protein
MDTTENAATVVGFDDSVLERMVVAVERVRERLKRATAALEAAAVPYAVVGGNAVAAWVSRIDPAAVRNTVDVDLLVRREDFETVQRVLESVGFEYHHTFGVPAFIDGPEGKVREAIHLLFANEKVRADYALPTPDLESAEPHESFRVIGLNQLVTMKLTSFRRKDQVHLGDMLEVGLIDANWLSKLPADLATRLQTLIDDPDG